MSIPGGMDERRVIPLWLSPGAATASGERAALTAPRRLTSREEHWLRKLTVEYEDSPTIESAMELVTTADVLGIPEYARSAREKVDRSKSGSLLAAGRTNVAPATTNSNSPGNGSAREAIAMLKRRLANPHQPLAWSELSRNYLRVGQKEKARRAMEAALLVASPSRYLLRAATRLFVHLDDPERAIGLLQKHPGLREDPWLLSAEISTNSVIGRSSKWTSHSKHQLLTWDVAPRHTTELRAALATVDYEDGRRKAAKEQFVKSSTEANNNVLAQIEWVGSIDPKLVLKLRVEPNVLIGEAEAWRARSDRNWQKVLTGCDSWISVEPFSSRPAMLASYTAHLALRNYRASIYFCDSGLAANPDNFTLLNNRAVANARLGNLPLALVDGQKASHAAEDEDIPVLLATLGLISFRGGEQALGVDLYKLSIDALSEESTKTKALIAMLHLAEELLRYSIVDCRWLLDRIKQLRPTITAEDPEMDAYLDLIEGDCKEKGKGAPPIEHYQPGLHEKITAIANSCRSRIKVSQKSEDNWTDVMSKLLRRRSSLSASRLGPTRKQ